ncbi:atypical membrane-integrating protein (Mistic protein) [Halobacillus amylolyticus]|uniref:Atypical membrane-integrating protein (Mistic protein) n=1 Tax=Halobacillus amylolyticus TaxID=2932259 RepID=A0ABY4HHD4_9BACI|nr:atypical membrane-integrating protein (Mistic protein) [Halobacillus amylolyticus]UOR14159.1 atypical membrane-integrating protein (Mistic protein) [Halobacillus amylolyticus]
MKATDIETKRFDKALDEILELFNNLENDDPIIHFGDDVINNIERAKKKYGHDLVDEKINTVVSEMLSWLDLEDADSEEDQQDEEDDT